jgi:hypothetical protein
MTTTDLARTDTLDPAALESLVLRGDISGLTAAQKVQHYLGMCRILGLDAATQPLAYLRLSGKEVLYVTRGATDRLAAMHSLNREIIDGPKVIDLAGTKLVIAVCRATLPGGRYETATATLPLSDPATVLMKAETKAKRRATLAILGLGLLDETEVDSIPGAQTVEPAPARPLVDLAHALSAIDEAETCEATVTAYRAAQDSLRRVVSLDAPEAAEPLASLLAAAVERMTDLGLSLPPSKARAVVADADLAALADELLSLRAGKGADAIVGWWLAHSRALDASVEPLAREMAGRLWAGVPATATPQEVAAVGKRWRAALAAPPAPPPAEEHGLVTQLREHLASKPSGAAPGSREHTSQLAAVCASYHKRLPDIADAGREDDALAVVRAELASRGCLDADALLAGVAARRKGAAKAE